MKRVLITGASGFIGRRLVEHVLSRGFEVVATSRNAADVSRAPRAAAFSAFESGDIGAGTDWRPALGGVDAVVHTAARVHVMRDAASDSESLYRQTNAEGTRALAEQAAEAGVRRFVFLSSIKVNGERTERGRTFTARDVPAPTDAYSRSKWAAEQALARIAAASPMTCVTVRPTLVYGPGVRANFMALVRAVQKGIPLPLGSIDNRRSMVGLSNLVELLVACLECPVDSSTTFLASDGDDLSTPQLIRKIAAALGRSPCLLPFPPSMLALAGRVLGQSDRVARVVESLQVDIGETISGAGWSPQHSVDNELRLLVAAARGAA